MNSDTPTGDSPEKPVSGPLNESVADKKISDAKVAVATVAVARVDNNIPVEKESLIASRELPQHNSDADTPMVSFCQFIRQQQTQTGKRIGFDLGPGDEPLRIRCDLTAEFPVAELAAWHQEKRVLDVSFFGLFGPSGALPQHYTQKMLYQARNNDFAMRDFLDMFNHRLLSYFYRTWEKHQRAVAFETAQSTGAEDVITQSLSAMVGQRIGPSGSVGRDRLHVRDSVFLYYAGHVSSGRKSADALRVLLRHAFGMQTRIVQFVGQWLYLSESDQSRMGESALGTSLGNCLGVDTLVGSRTWDNQNKFRIQLGPVSWEKFQQLTPPMQLLRKVVDVARRFVGPQYDFDLQIVIDRDHVRCAQLGDDQSSNLGWNTWLGDWPFDYDAQDAVFELPDYAPL